MSRIKNYRFLFEQPLRATYTITSEHTGFTFYPYARKYNYYYASFNEGEGDGYSDSNVI